MLTWKEIIARIAQRIAEALMGLLGLGVGACAYVAASAYEGWRQARQPEEQHHAQADEDDDETKRLIRELATLNAATAQVAALPDAHKEAKPTRRVCGACEDPEGGSPAPAVAPAPATHVSEPRPATPRRRYRYVRVEPDPNDADAHLGPMLPVLR